MRRDLYPYSVQAVENRRGISKVHLAVGALAVVGGVSVMSYVVGLGFSIVLFPIFSFWAHPILSSIVAVAGYGVWKWWKRQR